MPVLYSTNPWIAHDFAMKYRGGVHYVWCSEVYDPTTASTGSAAAAIAPSSSPKALFDRLKGDVTTEERHSEVIKRHRRTYKHLAADWHAAGEISVGQRDEIVATVTSVAWRIWRPQLYIIPRAPIEAAGRLISVPLKERAAYGQEFKILDLKPEEFAIIEGSFP